MQLRVDHRVIKAVICQGHAELSGVLKGHSWNICLLHLERWGELLVTSSLLPSCPKIPEALSLVIFIFSQPPLPKSGIDLFPLFFPSCVFLSLLLFSLQHQSPAWVSICPVWFLLPLAPFSLLESCFTHNRHAWDFDATFHMMSNIPCAETLAIGPNCLHQQFGRPEPTEAGFG